MGILVGAQELSHEWPGKRVLKGVTIGVNEGDRIGIVGPNGAGKSTLLEILAHHEDPDSGCVVWRNNIHVGLLAQDDDLIDSDTVIHAVVGDTPTYEWASSAKIRAILDALIGDINQNSHIAELSGGQRRRVDLARLLVGDWDVLMLDEPTNHLDITTITWLAAHLKSRWPAQVGALLVVTHDRWFLDEVCASMWEVHDGTIDPFEGGYSAYIQQRVERERQAAVIEERRQNTLRKELNWLAHGPKARTSKPKFRLDEARALLADDPPLRNPIELKRLAVSRLGKQVIELKSAGVSYGDTTVLNDIEWAIGPGERIGIVGANGAGKSTLLRLMSGELAPTTGSVRIGKSVRFGILSQRLDNLADKGAWRVRDLLASYKRSVLVDGKETSPEKLLERLGFDTRELMSPIAELSGGQRRRLSILCVLLEEPNVLILDEPGNDLDTDMLAVLEDLLDSWPGTLILVTHDRYLMERVVDDEWCLIDGRVRHLPGGVDEYLSMLANMHPAAEPLPSSSPCSQSATALSNAERRSLKKRQDAVARRLSNMQAEPDRLRTEMACVDPTDYAELTRLQTELDATQTEIDALESEWLELAEQIGE